jgi:hypothetical protein
MRSPESASNARNVDPPGPESATTTVCERVGLLSLVGKENEIMKRTILVCLEGNDRILGLK